MRRHSAALHAACVLYGTQHYVMKTVARSEFPLVASNACRFSLAFVFASAWSIGAWCRDIPYEPISPLDWPSRARFLRETLVLGALSASSFYAQTLALQYTSAGRSAYILYFNVKIVAVLNALQNPSSCTRQLLRSVSLATLGTALLTMDNLGSAWSVNRGDALSAVAAVLSALFIVHLDRVARLQYSTSGINAAYLGWTSFLLIVPSLNEATHFSRMTSPVAAGIVYLSIVTFVGQMLQTYGQRSVDSSHAALIFALDPVYNLLIVTCVFGERISKVAMIGASLITLAAVA